MPAEAKLDRLMMPELLRQKHLISERATEGFPSVRIQQLTAVASKRFLERQNPRASSTMPSDLSRRGTTSAPIVYRRNVRIFLAEMIATRGFVRTTHFSRARLWHFPTDAEALRVEHLQIQLDRTCVLVCRGYPLTQLSHPTSIALPSLPPEFRNARSQLARVVQSRHP